MPVTALLCAVLVLTTAAVVERAATATRGAGLRRRLVAGDGNGLGWPRVLGSALPPPPWLEARLDAAAIDVDAGLVWTGWLGGGAAAVLASAAVAGVGLAIVAILLVVVGPVVVLASMSGRRDRAVEASLPEALEAVARSLRSGASLHLAVGEAAESVPGVLGQDLAHVAVEAACGTPLARALVEWERRRPLSGVRLTVAALGLGAETGGAQGRAVDGVAETIRNRLAVAGEVRALSSQARYSGLVIALAPLGFSALASMTDERTAEFLFRTPVGLACLVGGIGLDAAAALWMHRLAQVEA